MSNKGLDFSNPSRTESTFFDRESDNMPCEAAYEEFNPPIALTPLIDCHARYVIKEVESQKELWDEKYDRVASDESIKNRAQYIINNQSEFLK